MANKPNIVRDTFLIVASSLAGAAMATSYTSFVNNYKNPWAWLSNVVFMIFMLLVVGFTLYFIHTRLGDYKPKKQTTKTRARAKRKKK